MNNPGLAGAGGPIRDAVLIAGPTASGKSAAALALAEREGRIIVNADSMQVYDVLRVLTARPDGADLARAPHLLYGHVHPSQPYSVGAWLGEVRRLADEGIFAHRPPIFVGGTGLYFMALCGGLAEIPAVSIEVRAVWRERLRADGSSALHAILTRNDPQAAAAIRPGDGQRIVRALEVLESTGRSITAWQGEQAEPIVDESRARRFVLEPERASLARNIDTRFEQMLATGALAEAHRIGALGLDEAMPAMKAIGVRELLAAERGEISLSDAAERAKAASRRFAKRQSTWFRTQLGDGWQRIAQGQPIPAT